MISFLYLLVFPVLLASLILYDFYKKRLSWRTFFIPIFLGLFFIALSLILNRDPIFPKTDIMHFNNFFLVSKVFIMGLFFPSVLFLIILKLVKANDFQKSLVLFFTFTSFIGSFLWVLYSDNIDANQLYRNSISSFFPLTLFVLIEKFFDHVFFNILDLALCSILLFFFILPKFNSVKLSPEQSAFVQSLVCKKRILFIPDENEVDNVYKFNERFYFKYNKIFYYNPEIHVLNLTSFSNSFQIENTEVEKEMIKYYRSISPFFENCEPISNLNSCIEKYINLWEIDVVIDERFKKS